MHQVYRDLVQLKIIHPECVTAFYPRVRDRDDIQVMKCEKSGVLFLNKVISSDLQYRSLKNLDYWNGDQLVINEDDRRRGHQFAEMVGEKKVLDIGCGMGGFLRLIGKKAQVAGIEIMPDVRELLCREGLDVRSSLREFDQSFDIVTLFHVFEHVEEPLSFLKETHDKLVVGGQIVIEVPHAKDALISFYQLDEFKAFTFWSQHLVLHTRESIAESAKAAGFDDISVTGYQRYGVANHLHWLAHKRPGGHEVWNHLNGTSFDREYSDFLGSRDIMDTLILTAKRMR